MSLKFEWNDRKASENLRKHGISFEEATTVFNDPLARILEDVAHSEPEKREIITGNSITNRLLVISFTEHNEERIRIISARAATRKERTNYEEYTSY